MPRTVLWVEDDARLSTLVAQTLNESGYDVVAVQGSMAALHIVAHRTPRLLITDIRLRLGEPHGLALARMMRRQFGIPILYVTGYPEILEGENLLGNVLYKPFEQRDLLAQARALLPLQ
jgi:DNA-binding response OmpR family regulator